MGGRVAHVDCAAYLLNSEVFFDRVSVSQSPADLSSGGVSDE